MDMARDLVGVAEVLEASFRGEMDPYGARAVREMRTIGRLGPLAMLVELFLPVGEGFSPGFVWVQEGRVVGNATMHRAPALGRGYIVGNVGVLPEYRGRGIARRLMEACLDKARDAGGEWVALEVRADNASARQLYQHLGFHQTGAVTQFVREANAASLSLTPSPIGKGEGHFLLPLGERPGMRENRGDKVRQARAGEEGAVLALAQAATPEGLRWAEPLRQAEFSFGWERRFDLWLSGRREAWWVVESQGWVVGAIEAETTRPPHEQGHLRMWVASGHACHAVLLDVALGDRAVAAHPMLISHPATDAAAPEALDQFGFRPMRTLAHMKLNLR
jgi:GNAT superfamily N-acetyltransferase